MKKSLITLPFFFIVNYSFPQLITPGPQRVELSQISGFMENKGQIRDQNGKEVSDVLYVFAERNFHLVLRKNSFSYELIQYKKTQTVSEATAQVISKGNEKNEKNAEMKTTTQRYDAYFRNYSKNVVVYAEGKSNDYINYYQGNSSPGAEVYYYNKVYYRNIYPHIDLVFTAPDKKNETLKYEYIIHPGGNVKDIIVEYETLNGIAIEDRSVVMSCDFGFVKEENLIAYQIDRDHPLKSGFITRGKTLSFDVQDYDHHSTLVLDPDIVWGTYYGTNTEEDISQEVFVDRDGNVLTTGQTGSKENFVTTGAYQTTYGGLHYDAFVLKLSPDGDRLWATYYGGNGNDIGYSIYADPLLNIYCGGDTRSGNDPVFHPFQPVPGGALDAFCLKLDKNGFIRWATYYGGSDEDHNRGITGDLNGNIYFTGYTKSENNISSPGSFQPVKAPLMDAFIVKFDSSGLRLWGTYYGGSDSDRAHACTVDKNNNVIVTGTTPSNNGIATPGAHQTVCAGSIDMFMVKFKQSGARAWGTYFGGTEEERGRECTTDAQGNIYITGYTTSETHIATVDAYQPLWAEGYDNGGVKNPDAYYAKFDPHGIQLYGTYLGGSNEERCRTIRLENDGSVILSGTSESPGLGTPGVYQEEISGMRDVFIAKFMTNGQLDWLTYYGGADDEDGQGLAVDKNGCIYVAGSTKSESGIATPGAFKDALSTLGPSDCLITKFIDRCFDRHEPNNSKNNAAFVSIPTGNSVLVNGEIGITGDKDFYSFSNVATASNMKITLTNLIKNYNLYLLGINGQIIAQSLNTGTINEEIILNTATVGTYKIKVQGKGTVAFSDTACYDLTINLSDSPFNQPNEEMIDRFASGEESQLFLYPNPVQMQLTITFETDESETIIHVYDQQGNVIDLPMTFYDGVVQLNTSSLSGGLYLLQVINEKTGKNETGKFVKLNANDYSTH